MGDQNRSSKDWNYDMSSSKETARISMPDEWVFNVEVLYDGWEQDSTGY